MKNTIQNKTKLVNSVFSDVYKKYDLMNDILSFGIHRKWKEKLLDWMSPQNQKKLIESYITQKIEEKDQQLNLPKNLLRENM